MKSRIFLLATALMVALGATVALAADHNDPNTALVATVDDETNAIKYFVCSLDEEADDFCDGVLDDFDADEFDWLDGFTVDLELEDGEEANHGDYVSALAHALEGPGKGCIMRHIAQTNWGKTGEADELDVIEVETMCNAGNGGEKGNKPDHAGQGKPDWAGPDGDKDDNPNRGPKK